MNFKVTVKTDLESKTESIETTFPITHMSAEVNGIIQSITATTKLDVSDEDYLYLNGYQTWSYTKERKQNEFLKGLQYVPKFLVNKYHFDRYGDYHFHSYPYSKGKFHGYTYMYIRKGNIYHLIASLNEEPGYTIFNYDNGTLTIERDASGIISNGKYPLLDLYEATGSEEEVFDGWFKAMHIECITKDKLYGYSSWYNHYENISSKTINEDLEGCKKILHENDLFQIDDGWQPCTGDWLECDSTKFPNGMKYETDKIHEAHFKAGLWVSPFLASVNSKLVTEHPDWLLKVDNKPWFVGCNWNGAYALDIDNKDVVNYIRQVFKRIFDEWNFDLVKLDFLYAAAPFGTSTETRSARMSRAIKLLREVCGNHLVLGCGVPFSNTLGIFEYNRIGCDVGLDWDDVWYMHAFHRERVSTKHSLANTIFRRQINHRGYLNDPDVIFIRSENCKLTDEEKHKLNTIDALLGGVFLTSDNPSNYTDEQIEKYNYYRHLSTATNIHTSMNGSVIQIDYELDGKKESFSLDTSIL